MERLSERRADIGSPPLLHQMDQDCSTSTLKGCVLVNNNVPVKLQLFPRYLSVKRGAKGGGLYVIGETLVAHVMLLEVSRLRTALRVTTVCWKSRRSLTISPKFCRPPPCVVVSAANVCSSLPFSQIYGFFEGMLEKLELDDDGRWRWLTHGFSVCAISPSSTGGRGGIYYQATWFNVWLNKQEQSRCAVKSVLKTLLVSRCPHRDPATDLL